MTTTRPLRNLYLLLGIIGVSMIATPQWLHAKRLIDQDPNGFAGIEWGTLLSSRPDLVLVEPDDRINTFQFQETPPRFDNIAVESLKLLSIDGQFARVMIRYQGSLFHKQIMEYLETQFGEIKLRPNSMMRGLNQGYLWRGSNTEINLNYRGLGERGFVMFQSRILAPRFLDSLSEHSH